MDAAHKNYLKNKQLSRTKLIMTNILKHIKITNKQTMKTSRIILLWFR